MESSNSVSCKLKVPKNSDDKTPPFLVDFSNGSVNLNSCIKLNFTSFRHSKENIVSSKPRRILIASNDRLNYQSSIVDNSNCDQKLRYYIGVRNKASGKMKVYNTMAFHLKPERKTTDFKVSSTEAEAKNFKERLDDLTVNFGSKTKKRAMNAQQKYATTDHESLDHALEDMSLNNQSLASADISVLNTPSSIDYIPPQNPHAQSVDEVYDINDIISAEEDDYLTVKATLLLQDLPTHFSQWKSDSTYCEYVLKHFEGSIDEVKVKYLLYYNYLAVFSRLLASDIRKRDPAAEIPEPVKSYLLDRFTVSMATQHGKTTRSFSKQMKDKLLAYMLVLALFIDDFNVNLALVQNGMKYGAPKVANIAQVLGCCITPKKIENALIKFAQLKLPLPASQKYYKKF